MITMSNLAELRIQQHILNEIYRQQIMQRLPDPFYSMLPVPMPHHMLMPARITLLDAEVTLQNDDLWQQFCIIGTEMIITKTGRRMFPSMRLSLAGLDEKSSYCLLLEMVPVGDCRYKFSGSQWLPAGGAEPQSSQRMFLHPDSPATGAHWQAQPIVFNKVKLTNNTLDNNGHIVLASMHKYQPRIHVIRTADLTQIPWAPQQAFVFPETEFVAVTAYQNDSITRLKIDNNPFAKGFRETGQSRCKRKMSTSPLDEDPKEFLRSQMNGLSPAKTSECFSMCCTSEKADRSLLTFNTEVKNDQVESSEVHLKRMRFNDSALALDVYDAKGRNSGKRDTGTCDIRFEYDLDATKTTRNSRVQRQLHISPSPPFTLVVNEDISGVSINDVSNAGRVATFSYMHHFQYNLQSLLRPPFVDLTYSYFGRPHPLYVPQVHVCDSNPAASVITEKLCRQRSCSDASNFTTFNYLTHSSGADSMEPVTSESLSDALRLDTSVAKAMSLQMKDYTPKTMRLVTFQSPPKRKGFSISAILDS